MVTQRLTGKRKRAEDAFTQAAQLYVASFGPDHAETRALERDIAAFRAGKRLDSAE